MSGFFSGSCTTAQAILEMNASDGISRKIICVQLPEPMDQESEAYNSGYKTIADIGRQRFYQSIRYIKNTPDLFKYCQDDVGVKVFKLAPSNFKQWRGDDIESTEELEIQIELFKKSEKDNAETQNILYELLLKLGHSLATPIDKITVEGVPIYAINDHDTLFVLNTFNFDMIKPLLDLQPHEIIALDSVFHDSDELKSNIELSCRDMNIQFVCI